MYLPTRSEVVGKNVVINVAKKKNEKLDKTAIATLGSAPSSGRTELLILPLVFSHTHNAEKITPNPKKANN